MRQLAAKRPQEISLQRYCKLLNLNRSSCYYTPKGESDENLTIMAKMDK